MQERIYKTQISDIKLEATIYESAFHLNNYNKDTVMTQIKCMHQHSTHEIFLIVDGSLTICDEKTKCDYSNCAVIIPPRYNHYTVSNLKNGYCMYLSIYQAEPKKKNCELIFDKVASKINSEISRLPLDEESRFYTTHIEKHLSSYSNEENVTHLISLLFASIFNTLSDRQTQGESDIEGKCRKYIHVIESCIADDIDNSNRITLAYLAEKLYLCPKQVSRIIRKEYGCSLSELINRRRLTVACMLLKQTNLGIAQIASMVGYDYENYFFTLFKKEYGTSPSRYRAQFLKNHKN